MAGPQYDPVVDHTVLSGHVITCFPVLLETRLVSSFGSARAVWSEAALQQHIAAVAGNDLYRCDLVDRHYGVTPAVPGTPRRGQGREKLAPTAVCAQTPSRQLVKSVPTTDRGFLQWSQRRLE